ncbi:Prefoldin subunit-domain-containing protein [Lipomyces tetrasporus]|uniref:Prefoldin subunit 3 n=1 Tax=Lipomyces tetrasporus TaxID=54092 RepID=A0AAD7QKU7_9ASCO|nr:Prefoldin subunit-domain-containing protein [Lipomyces tetrasporus]KAJ8097129.1 Prefoldin subunit-domain-containing protein [Lipomyces tetrasporus]
MASSTAPRMPGETGYVNPRGIPQAPFIEVVEDYVRSRDQVESVLQSFQEMLSKYKYMEMSTLRRAASLREKIPDIQKTLDSVLFLDSKRNSDDSTLSTTFELNDTLYAKANITPTDTVYLWLGANVMLEYPIGEATDLLTSKLNAAKESLKTCQEDLEFLRENITTVEVNTARVYNWDVQQRREEKQAAAVK